LGQVFEEKLPLPAQGTSKSVTLPSVKNGKLIFRVISLTDEERCQVLESAPSPPCIPTSLRRETG
jgi:hypothetical protein